VAKATAARVMSVAMGEQILLSANARHVLTRTWFRLQSHGHWRLKGLDEPIELFEIGDDRTRFSPPPDVEQSLPCRATRRFLAASKRDPAQLAH
jgi:class 3 adenylate cyclase